MHHDESWNNGVQFGANGQMEPFLAAVPRHASASAQVTPSKRKRTWKVKLPVCSSSGGPVIAWNATTAWEKKSLRAKHVPKGKHDTIRVPL